MVNFVIVSLRFVSAFALLTINIKFNYVKTILKNAYYFTNQMCYTRIAQLFHFLMQTGLNETINTIFMCLSSRLWWYTTESIWLISEVCLLPSIYQTFWRISLPFQAWKLNETAKNWPKLKAWSCPKVRKENCIIDYLCL